MMRWLLACALVSACSHPPSGPAWPKPSDDDVDGGESIAPHVARAGGAGPGASSSSDDDDDKPAAASTTAPAAPATDVKPVVDKSMFDDPLLDGDLTIEIED